MTNFSKNDTFFLELLVFSVYSQMYKQKRKQISVYSGAQKQKGGGGGSSASSTLRLTTLITTNRNYSSGKNLVFLCRFVCILIKATAPNLAFLFV